MVTFSVNMASVTTSPDGVFLAGGEFFGVPGDNPMNDDDGDDVWVLTMELDANFSGYYTFTNGNCPSWGCKENLAGQPCGDPENFNDRWLPEVTMDQTILHCFGQCSTDGSCEETGGPLDVTFRVDMNEQTVTGPVYVTGSTVDGWCGTCVEMLDDDGDGIYEHTMTLDPGPHEYKFNNGGWAGTENLDSMEDAECTLTTGEFVNRLLTVEGDDPIVLDAVCFNSCDECEGIKVETAPVTFKVDMNMETIQGAIYVSGNTVDSWCGTCVEMLDDDADGVYEVTLDLPLGAHEYKFNNSSWDFSEALDEVEDADCTITTGGFTNRYLEISSTDAVELDEVCFGSCAACPVSVSEISAAQFMLYPTVTNEQLNVVFSELSQATKVLTIHNTALQIVNQYQVGAQASNMVLDVSAFAPGIYFLNVEADGAKEVKKFIVTK